MNKKRELSDQVVAFTNYFFAFFTATFLAATFFTAGFLAAAFFIVVDFLAITSIVPPLFLLKVDYF